MLKISSTLCGKTTIEDPVASYKYDISPAKKPVLTPLLLSDLANFTLQHQYQNPG
jgi:hypothetical protein